MARLYVILLFSLFCINLQAQSTQIEFTGHVISYGIEDPVGYATISLMDRSDNRLIDGTTTDENGDFKLPSPNQDVIIEVSFIGFKNQRINQFEVVNGKADLGTIVLSPDAEILEEVVVRGEVSQTEFKLDKRVFNVGKDLSTTGASALEVLNNVPSVNVSIEGNISLRGSQGVQILINGKPSVLASDGANALGTITADMIDKIEVVTNPSAKYDAEGTAGIINIVIKKDERRGMNGSVSVNVGSPDNNSVGLSLNRRSDKFNLFTQLGLGYRELPNDLDSRNTDLIGGEYISSTGREYRNEEFYNLILGTDYYVNDHSVITLSGSYAFEKEDQPSSTSFRSFDANDNLISNWNRTESTTADNPKYRYELQYSNEIGGDEDHTLMISALGNLFAKDQSSVFNDNTISGVNSDNQQLTRTDFGESVYTFKADYARPLNEKYSIEVGSQYVLNDVSNEYEVQNLVDDEFVIDPGLTNTFEFDQKVFALYGTAAYEHNKWGLKAGLRMETTDLKTLLVNNNQANDQNYTNLFPSAHTSYKFSDRVSLQAGYSRRIYRPRLWELNPFFNIRNNFNIRLGNPNLQAEYSDSYEITSIFLIGNVSLNVGVFHRYTTDVIERIALFEEGVTTSRPENIGTNKSTGIELNSKLIPYNWLTINVDLNYGSNKREGSYEETVFDFNANQWSSKLICKMKLPWSIDVELTPNYRSSYKTVQGEVEDQIYLDLGMRKKLLKNRGVVSLSIRDVFASRVGESFVYQPTYEIYNRRQRGRFVALGFSYGFGKGEAMEFTGTKRYR